MYLCRANCETDSAPNYYENEHTQRIIRICQRFFIYHTVEQYKAQSFLS